MSQAEQDARGGRNGRKRGVQQRANADGGGQRGGTSYGPPKRRPTKRQGVTVNGEFEVAAPQTPGLPPVATFAEAELPRGLQSTLVKQGVTEPFPIQAATLPNALAGRDVLGRGRTGSGKTLAFGLAVLGRLAGRRAEIKAPLALVLVPTRELAQQVQTALTPYATAVNLRLATVVGGLPIGRQAAELKRGVDVLIATPGRLRDLLDRGDVQLGRVEITVLDEADQMADMGFLPQVTALLEQVRPDGQRLLFSATLDQNVDRLVRRFLNDPVAHSVDPSAGAVTSMEHHVLYVTDQDKREVTREIAAREGRVIMFVDTKRATDRLAKDLLANGVLAAALHGGKTQPQRNRVLEQFKQGQVTALIATNVAARGIHVDDLDLVVNVDPPTDPKDYLHRGGRTARAGASGTVVTLVLSHERRDTAKLMTDAGIRPNNDRVRPGDPELVRITGARRPSGVPVTLPTPTPPAASKPAASRSGASRAAGPKAARNGERPQRNGRPQRTEQRGERVERTERTERTDRPQRATRGERGEQSGTRTAASGRPDQRRRRPQGPRTTEGA
ncbi:DEAD/DEAH box helicase [Streptacidiphilus fuscans]|uniref:DEAD/DEAH box helicase n=1 Tax=Streptacidiphilus fuscans TaxID=2789292 RepID=A0A931FC31_9ACTN|nr:DEAD/DEAH box helicase [Streptacidiphilus fuscans]MBF9066755.1 DEAD/DEAH box helicase [Streptacidiphilus fuscans]